MSRNLNKKDLGGVIFGCTLATIKECLTKNLFGLPSQHFLYVQNIKPGLPLFLFNFSDRKMHGIYEAVTSGQFNADPYAWTNEGEEKTAFPAQVRIRVRTKCEALSEKQFIKVIKDNYYTHHHFYFELDHAQTKSLESLFKPLTTPASIKQLPAPSYIVKPSAQTLTWKKEIVNRENVDPVPAVKPKSYAETLRMNTLEPAGTDDFNEEPTRSRSPSDHGNAEEPAMELEDPVDLMVGDDAGLLEQPSFNEGTDKEMDRISQKLMKIYVDQLPSTPLLKDSEAGNMIPNMNHNLYKGPLVTEESFVQLQGHSELLQILKTLTHRMTTLEKKQDESNQELQELRNEVKESGLTIEHLNKRVEELESQHYSLSLGHDTPVSESLKLIYLIGGFDGFAWSSALDSFSPSEDKLIHLKPMNYHRCFVSATALDDYIFVIGGGDNDNSWYPTVERYSRSDNDWDLCPSLSRAKGNCSAATLDKKIYAIGGGDGIEGLTDVEMFDPILGKWIYCQSMFQKRFSAASVQLDGALYTVGGYDGNFYLRSAERYDPRVGHWMRIPSMNTKRGCHSLAVLDNKIYAMGGYDDEKMISSVEVFDPRLGSWVFIEPMNSPKGYGAAGVIGDTLFAIGGLKSGGEILDIVECYKEGAGWSICPSKVMGRRCFLSAVVL